MCMYLWIVRLLTLIPSLSSSPRILSAPQSLFAAATDRISVAVLGERREAGRVRLRHRQRALKPPRCQRMSVSGWTIRRTFSPGRRDRGERDEADAVQPCHTRPGDRALHHGELVSEQGDLSEQRQARAESIQHSSSEQEDGLQHGWRKGTPTGSIFPSVTERLVR